MTIPANAQWIRQAQVVVGKNGNGILVDKLRIDFEITKTIQPSPNSGIIKIYNLNPNNETLIHDEYTDIIVNAGYKNNVRILFSGNIKHVFKYKQKTDYITEIEAADGDNDYRNSYLSETLSAGTTREHIVQRAVASFKAGTTQGFTGIDPVTNSRAVVLAGSTRRILDRLAKDSGANWSIQDGQLTIVKANATLPNTAIVMNSQSGMLEAPEINDKGIRVKCLLNPQLAVNGVVKLNNNDIRVQERRVNILSKKADKIAAKTQQPVRLDPDGLYKIIRIRHHGDNRGKDWTSEVACVSLSQPIPASSSEE